MTGAPGFLTNHELDQFLGGGDSGQRQRQRLLAAHLLPSAVTLGKVRRFNVALLPRFVLAGLARDLARIPHATETMQDVAARTLRSEAFGQVSAAVRESVRSFDHWSFDELVDGVVERAADAVHEWDEDVDAAEQELTERLGISFLGETGVVREADADVCVIALDSGGEEHVPSTRVVTAGVCGRAVLLQRVKVLSKEVGYVMPVENFGTEPGERDLAAWFASMSQPIATPGVVTADETYVSDSESVPYGRAYSRRGHWHGSSTMTRVPAVR
jgi:hypothetical protein